MGAFQSGFQLGQSAYHQAERNRLLQAQEERAAKEFGWREQEQNRKMKLQGEEDAAFEQLNLASTGMAPQTQQQITQTYGLTPQQMAQAGGGAALKAQLAGYDQPDAHELQNVPAAGLQRTFTADQFKPQAANPVDVERAMGRVALAKRDMAGFRASAAAEKALQREGEVRGFLQTSRQLYDQRNETPEAMDAWIKHVSPYTAMISRYQGADFDARVNPKTGALEVIPYEGGKVQGVSYEEAAPYLLNAFQASSQYGDPEAALKALNEAAKAERTRAREDSSFRLGVADKVSGSVVRAAQLEETSRHNRATEGIQSASAANQRRALGNAYKNIREFVDAKGNTVLLDLNNLQAGADGTLAIPQGLRPKTARPEVTQKDVVDYAKALVENQTRDPDAPNKPLSLDKALQVARAQLSGEGYTSAADRLVQAYMENRGKQADTAPAAEAPRAPGPTPPARKPITTIVPPRTAADLAPKTPLSDEDIIKLLAR